MAAETWARGPKDELKQLKRGGSAKRTECARKPFEEKETYRLLTTAEHCSEIKESCPDTQLVMRADRESDITDVIDDCRGQQSDKQAFDWIVRSEVSRILKKQNKAETPISVHDAIKKSRPLFERELDIRERYSWGNGSSLKHHQSKADRRSRELTLIFHAARVIVSDRRVGKPDGVEVNAVMVRETNFNTRDQSLEWLLLTSLPISSRKGVELAIEYYLLRWVVELFFKVLKSGCRIESRRFEHIDRFLPALSLYLFVAW